MIQRKKNVMKHNTIRWIGEEDNTLGGQKETQKKLAR